MTVPAAFRPRVHGSHDLAACCEQYPLVVRRMKILSHRWDPSIFLSVVGSSAGASSHTVVEPSAKGQHSADSHTDQKMSIFWSCIYVTRSTLDGAVGLNPLGTINWQCFSAVSRCGALASDPQVHIDACRTPESTRLIRAARSLCWFHKTKPSVFRETRLQPKPHCSGSLRGGFGVAMTPVGSRVVTSALRTTAGRRQQKPDRPRFLGLKKHAREHNIEHVPTRTIAVESRRVKCLLIFLGMK